MINQRRLRQKKSIWMKSEESADIEESGPKTEYKEDSPDPVKPAVVVWGSFER